MVVYVGDTFADTLTILDTTNTPVTGQTFIAEVNSSPTGVPIAYNVSELGSGAYRVTFTPTAVGAYYLQLRTTSQIEGQYRRFGIAADVDGVNPATPISLSAQNGTSLRDLRRMVAMAVKDWMEGVATADGTTTTFVDELNFVESDDHFRGAEVVFISGTGSNVGLKRRILNSSLSGLNISLTPELPASTVEGDVIHIFNVKGGTGHRIYEYNHWINDVIRKNAPATDLLVQQTVDDLFDQATGVIAIPELFDSISIVQWLGHDNKWYDIEPINRNQYSGWWVNHATREIVVGGDHAWLANERSIRLVGYTAHPPLGGDDEYTRVDADFIVALAAQGMVMSRRRNEDFGLVGQLKNDAEMARAKMAMRPRLPNTVRLR